MDGYVTGVRRPITVILMSASYAWIESLRVVLHGYVTGVRRPITVIPTAASYARVWTFVNGVAWLRNGRQASDNGKCERVRLLAIETLDITVADCT